MDDVSKKTCVSCGFYNLCSDCGEVCHKREEGGGCCSVLGFIGMEEAGDVEDPDCWEFLVPGESECCCCQEEEVSCCKNKCSDCSCN